MEQQPKGPEQGEFKSPELEASPEATKGPERSAETPQEKQEQVESARQQVEKLTQPEQGEAAKEAAPKPKSSGLDRRLSYKETMASIQRHLPTVSRAFSKTIHNPAVEKTSEALGATVMRPSVTLGATSTALLVGGFTYLFAKHYGYGLRGSEIILSLVVGAAIGLLVEGLSKLLRKRA